MPNWNQILNEIDKKKSETNSAFDIVRRKYLKKLHAHTKRNVIAYYSGFLSKPKIDQSGIVDEDKNGFMMAVHNLNRDLGLDLVLHTPGGDVAATESIVNYLHKMFSGNIRAIVPQIAMSAGTMLACSCSSILMGKHSNLGPIDPHLNNIPAHGVIEELKRAHHEVSLDPNKAFIWAQIMSKYHPTFIGQCENAILWAKEFVKENLENIMFHDDKDGATKAQQITEWLSDYSTNKSHSRHIHLDQCKEKGLIIEELEDDAELQDLVLTAHHCYMHTLMNTNAFKIIENHKGIAYVKQQVIMSKI